MRHRPQPFAPAEAKALHKFYTRDDVAAHCRETFFKFVPQGVTIVEPSAGGGAFLRGSSRPIRGFDIAPEADGVTRLDFLHDPFPIAKPCAFTGNPPFGQRNDLAVRFLNRALMLGETVGFILPAGFQRYSVQHKIREDARLIHSETLDEDSFTLCGEPFSLRSVFQIWTRSAGTLDLRIREKPPSHHDDFSMMLHNGTKPLDHYLEQGWCFATNRQGQFDYVRRYWKEYQLIGEKRHYMFFRPHSALARRRLLALDFVALSKLNIGAPGYGKADVVRAYQEKYG